MPSSRLPRSSGLSDLWGCHQNDRRNGCNGGCDLPGDPSEPQIEKNANRNVKLSIISMESKHYIKQHILVVNVKQNQIG